MRRAVFIDRDGVLNVSNDGYVYGLADFKLYDGVPEALVALHRAHFLLIVITNQGGISRGVYRHEDVHACHLYLQKEVGWLFKGIFYSPYHRTKTLSLSSKPSSYMIERARHLYGIQTEGSWMIGDRQRDIEAGKSAGLQTMGIRSVSLSEDFGAEVYARSLQDAHARRVGPYR